jgi:uncharacterized protein (DUF305 family)
MMKSHYGMLGLNLGLSAVIMYLVMFTMIDSTGEFYNNIDNVYMTLMMVSPMAILMLLMMGSMYRNRALNLVLYAAFAAIFILSFVGMRTQALVGDDQFLRAMIPHHSGAILMCREARISDPEIAALCARIRQSQKEEIDQMKAVLARR